MLWSESIIRYKSGIKLPENFSENYSITSLKKWLSPCIYTFPSPNSLNSTTSHPFLHDCPLIVLMNVLDNQIKNSKSLKRLVSCAFSPSPVSLIITSIHSSTAFTNNSLLLILHAKYSMTWRAVATLLESDPYQGWSYWHSKRWTLQTSVHRQISNHSCVETDPYQGWSIDIEKMNTAD